MYIHVHLGMYVYMQTPLSSGADELHWFQEEMQPLAEHASAQVESTTHNCFLGSNYASKKDTKCCKLQKYRN